MLHGYSSDSVRGFEDKKNRSPPDSEQIVVSTKKRLVVKRGVSVNSILRAVLFRF